MRRKVNKAAGIHTRRRGLIRTCHNGDAGGASDRSVGTHGQARHSDRHGSAGSDRLSGGRDDDSGAGWQCNGACGTTAADLRRWRPGAGKEAGRVDQRDGAAGRKRASRRGRERERGSR